MVRRVHGDPNIPSYIGSAEHRKVQREQAERERRHRRFVEAALEFANPAALGPPGSTSRRFAEVCAETMAGPESTARDLNERNVPRGDGQPWTAGDVISGISALWPYERSKDWPREFGTYPGYLGGLRDDFMPRGVPGKVGALRHQIDCVRCGALWPPGWPGTDEGCPDCGNPGFRVSVDTPQIRQHSVIDLHWMLYRYAPADAGPCPVCGTVRELYNAGRRSDPGVRFLDWACPSEGAKATAFDAQGHYRTALAQAWWGSEAAHHAYWMAVDMLRVAAETGEVTELPAGALYEALDGSGRKWRYDGEGWSPLE